jgi:hypothetical protein
MRWSFLDLSLRDVGCLYIRKEHDCGQSASALPAVMASSAFTLLNSRAYWKRLVFRRRLRLNDTHFPPLLSTRSTQVIDAPAKIQRLTMRYLNGVKYELKRYIDHFSIVILSLSDRIFNVKLMQPLVNVQW